MFKRHSVWFLNNFYELHRLDVLHWHPCISPPLLLSAQQAQLPPLQILSAVLENGRPCLHWCHRESGRSEVRAESLSNVNTRRLRLNLRECIDWQARSPLLIVCFNQALSQGSGSCRTSGICRIQRDVQWKWEHRPEGRKKMVLYPLLYLILETTVY